MKVTDLPKLLTGFRYNSFPKEYSNLNEALDALKLFISENWEKLHADIIKSIAELKKRKSHRF